MTTEHENAATGSGGQNAAATPRRVWHFVGAILRYENGVLQETIEHSPINSSSSVPLVMLSDYEALRESLAAEKARADGLAKDVARLTDERDSFQRVGIAAEAALAKYRDAAIPSEPDVEPERAAEDDVEYILFTPADAETLSAYQHELRTYATRMKVERDGAYERAAKVCDDCAKLNSHPMWVEVCEYLAEHFRSIAAAREGK